MADQGQQHRRRHGGERGPGHDQGLEVEVLEVEPPGPAAFAELKAQLEDANAQIKALTEENVKKNKGAMSKIMGVLQSPSGIVAGVGIAGLAAAALSVAAESGIDVPKAEPESVVGATNKDGSVRGVVVSYVEGDSMLKHILVFGLVAGTLLTLVMITPRLTAAWATAGREEHAAGREKHAAEREKHAAEREKHAAEREKHAAEREKHRAEVEAQALEGVSPQEQLRFLCATGRVSSERARSKSN